MKLNIYQTDTKKIVDTFTTNIQSGLSKEEVKKRQQKYGGNALPRPKSKSYLFMFLQQLNNAFLYLLMAAAVMKYFLNDYRDAIIIMVIVFFNALIAAIQEGKAQRILESLQKFIKTKCVVVRDGENHIVNEHEVVPGDIILVQEGSRIPADARLIETSLLKVNESVLTGESTGILKQEGVIEKNDLPIHNQKNMLFMGTHVISGNGKAVVVATGLATEIGKVRKTLEHISTKMPLQKDLKKLSKIIIAYTVLISIVLFIFGIYLGKDPETMFFTLISLFISVVPESLPAIATIVLSLGAYRMAKANVLVKRLPAIEALGRVNVLVVDKTGTLTRNEQMVKELFIEEKHYTVTGQGYHSEGTIFYNDTQIQQPQEKTSLWYMGLAMNLLDKSELSYNKKENTFALQGEPMHAAFGACSKKLGFDQKMIKNSYQLVSEIPFTSESGYYTAYYEFNGEGLVVLVGKPEIVMRQKSSITQKIETAFNKMLDKGLRVVAIAYKTYPTNKQAEEKKIKTNLNFLGLVGMQDALRDGLSITIDAIKNAGLQVIMATGDHHQTARYVAKAANIFHEGDEVLEGKDFRILNEEEIKNRLVNTTVLSRITPQEKLEVVGALHARNKIVAMTGDGVNDVPALAAADVGIAMGSIGTEVAKEAADIVLLDDSLTSIVAGITQGRHILATLRRVFFFLFTTSMSEFLIIAVSIFLQLPLPLLATQILWLNLVTDGFLDIGLSLEPVAKDTLDHKNVDSIFITKKSVGKLIWMGSLMAIGTLFIFMRYYQTNLALARTMTLLTLAIFQWFNAWNLRSEEKSVFRMNPLSNPWLLGMTIAIIILQIFAIYNDFMQKALHLVPLSLHHWIQALAIASTILFIEELRKFFVCQSARYSK